MSRRRGHQLELEIRTWGGKRVGAGRKAIGDRAGVSHLSRPRFERRHPVHVTIRLVPEAERLRNRRAYAVVRRCLAAAQRDGFSVVEYAVMSNHLHLLVEADSNVRLGRGMQGLLIRLARGLNRAMGRVGRLFSDRYHARVLRTPLEVKRALLYVLNNARRHAAQHGRRFARGWIDPFASGVTFLSWSRPPSRPARARCLAVSAGARPPTAEARCWLLRIGWLHHGTLSVDAVPG